MILRCKLDGLLLPAGFHPAQGSLIALDGDEPFVMEAVEAIYYEVAAATEEELLRLELAGYRLLRRAEDFRLEMGSRPSYSLPELGRSRPWSSASPRR